MKKHAYEIDYNGYYVDLHLVEVDDKGVAVNPDERNYILVDPPQPNNFLRMKWDGRMWVEGATQQELSDREFRISLNTLAPTPEQVTESELEIKILTILIDMEVI